MFKTLLLISLAFACVVSATEYNTINGKRDTPIVTRTPKVFDIDLNASYRDRWAPVLDEYGADLRAFIDHLGVSDKAQKVLALLDKVDYPVLEAYNKEFAQEVKAISDYAGLSFTEVAVLNFIYDITAQCTSVLIQDPTGNVFHSRNLDFPYAPFLASMLFHGRYFRDGKLLYEGISLVGYLGVITGVKPNAFSFSIDQYVLPGEATKAENITNIVMGVAQIFRRKLSPTYVVRKGFETLNDYDSFVNYLKETDTVSRAYYIVAGAKPGQGTVITKYRNSVQNQTSLSFETGKWYVAQSNYRGDIPDPANDNRATAARDFLNAVGVNGITHQTLLDGVMSNYPVFNNETLHTTIMQPSTGYINTTIWW
jgi:N-acylethanolamine-hydrolysing acid amidase